MWPTFFRDGGWGMYPTTIFGFLLAAAAVLCVLRPERRWQPLFASLALLTLGSGTLGTATGFISTARYLEQVPKAEQVEIAALGVAESLNNLVLALIIVVVASLAAAVASLRVWRASAKGAASR